LRARRDDVRRRRAALRPRARRRRTRRHREREGRSLEEGRGRSEEGQEAGPRREEPGAAVGARGRRCGGLSMIDNRMPLTRPSATLSPLTRGEGRVLAALLLAMTAMLALPLFAQSSIPNNPGRKGTFAIRNATIYPVTSAPIAN